MNGYERVTRTIVRVILDDNYESLNLKLDRPTKLKIITRYIATKTNPIALDDKITINSKDIEVDYDCFGVVTKNAEKSLKFTLDFKNDQSNTTNPAKTSAQSSVGHEKEEVLLLGRPKKCVSSPIILCSDPSSSGSHGVTLGETPKKDLDYLKSRGLSEREAKKLLIESRFKKAFMLAKSPEKSDNNLEEKFYEILGKIL